MEKATTVDDYIAMFEGDTKKRLVELRALISSQIPGAEERISYAIPAYKLKRYVVYFAGYKTHVSMYPMPALDEKLRKEFAPYASGKSTARFPHDKPLPTALIKKIVKLLIVRSNEWGK